MVFVLLYKRLINWCVSFKALLFYFNFLVGGVVKRIKSFVVLVLYFLSIFLGLMILFLDLFILALFFKIMF